jgi:hypothetical protein
LGRIMIARAGCPEGLRKNYRLCAIYWRGVIAGGSDSSSSAPVMAAGMA